MVLLTLDTGAKHEGLLEAVAGKEMDGYVKISNSNEVFMVPEDDIISVESARLN
ncbi:hypothetical protein [Paenibacillus luteus]|uniref:hypothetical protein n=1 Tax=Paenibacillus luteus TaxID=2545753 RepID=UPI0019D6464F|nr:hypothetical protein [Paenibacillus luteus]